MDLADLNDWDLISAGSPEAFEVLFRRHRDRVYRLGRSLTGDSWIADDVTQEVFIRLYRGRRRWRQKGRLETLLYRMTVITTRELLRKQRTERTMRERLTGETRADQTRPVEGDPDTRELDELLALLPPRQRETVLLRFYEGLSVRDTAHALGCREGTVKAHLHRALHRLRQHFEARQCPEGDEEWMAKSRS
jgi:RNA polymerase sigma-70 factor (ECF subfamily)